MEIAVFLVAAAIVLTGALGVIVARNPVHSALLLIQTLFGVAALFVLQDAHFLAAVQIIVYAGAIVILFLFVIMLLGVDQAEDLDIEPIGGQRPLAVVVGAAVIGLLLTVMMIAVEQVSGLPGATKPVQEGSADIAQLAEVLFTDYVFAFELTAVLLTIAVVGAVALARKPKGPLQPLPPMVDPADAEQGAA